MDAVLKKKFSNPVCQQCIKEHFEKYDKGYVDESGRIYNDFAIPCQGIPTQYLSDHLQAILDDNARQEAVELFDPVTWAANWIKLPDGSPWVARWYQETMLRCSATRKISRAGRRIGKCLEENTEVMTPTGPVKIQELQPGDTIYAYDAKTDSISETPVVEVHDRGIQDVVDLYRRNNRVISCTATHRWHTINSSRKTTQGVRKLEDFTRDTCITRRFVDIPGGNIDEPHAYAIGTLLGDGNSKEYRDRYAHEKTCDLDVIKTWNRKSQLSYLAGLLDADGCVQVTEGNLMVSWTMQAINIVKSIQYLLLSLFQYKANIHADRREKYKNGPVYYLRVKNNLFAKKILQQLDQYVVVEKKKWKSEYADLVEHNENPQLMGFNFDAKNTRKAQCYDISIATEDHLYLLANGLVTHNSDALAVMILYRCFTRKNFRVLVVAPYKAHTEEIIGRIRGFVTSNPKLASSVKRDVSSPYYEIRFKNGSRIRGFSSGTKSGAEGDQIRGQDADFIVLDEADRLTDADLGSVVAIVNTTADVELWASSTPTGRRTHFWRWCTKSPSYKEFYYPSSVLPHWEQVKDQIRADYVGNPDGYTHEIEALWGEDTVGVFQNVHVDLALADYKYENLVISPKWIYGVGVDWNSDFGTEIVTVGYDGNGNFQIVDALNVPKQNWTQLTGIEAVISMNAKWCPAFIYADEGYGATNLELLRKYGYDMIARDPSDPACKLKDIVHGYNFSSKIDARDPVTRTPIKKHAKPFLIENAVRFFEERRIQISAWDSVLKSQLENYIIAHRTTAGIPVYGLIEKKVGDHRLDAFMLALVGFKLEMSDFGRARYSSHVAVSPGFAGLDTTRSHISVEQELNQRLQRMPRARFDQGEHRLTTHAHAALPAMTSYKVPEHRHGFMTDEEEKYSIKHRMRSMRKRGRLRHIKPERSNI